MPTYEYACQACGHQFEREQSMKDAPVKICPQCKQPKAERMISQGPGFILKGGGWYSDLYHKPKERTQTAEASESVSTPTETKTASKVQESTPEKKSKASPAKSEKSSPAKSSPAKSSKGKK